MLCCANESPNKSGVYNSGCIYYIRCNKIANLRLINQLFFYFIHFSVSEFAKKTGDFKSLSAVDLRILGLTYQLEKEFCDAGHIRNEPYKKVCLSNLCL